MLCEKCKNHHNGSYGSGRFCSRACANSRVQSKETKEKVSLKLKGVKPWNTGFTLSEDHKNKIADSHRGTIKPQIPDNEAFVKNSTLARHIIKKRIIRDNLFDYKCSCCGLTDYWNGKKLSLQLDHINGINNDNRLENLRFLCPNCHSQQDTYASKNIVKQKSSCSSE